MKQILSLLILLNLLYSPICFADVNIDHCLPPGVMSQGHFSNNFWTATGKPYSGSEATISCQIQAQNFTSNMSFDRDGSQFVSNGMQSTWCCYNGSKTCCPVSAWR